MRFTILLSTLLLSCPASAQWQIAEPLYTRSWQYCMIQSVAYTGACSTTVITVQSGTINIHFDLDDNGIQGLTWGIGSMPSEGSKVFPVALVAERFGVRKINYLAGECKLSPQQIFCVTRDGRHLAVARQPISQ